MGLYYPLEEEEIGGKMKKHMRSRSKSHSRHASVSSSDDGGALAAYGMKKPKSKGKPRGDGGKSLMEYNAKVKHLREKHPEMTLTEARRKISAKKKIIISCFLSKQICFEFKKYQSKYQSKNQINLFL